MANLYLPAPEFKRLKRLARAAGYKIKRGPGSQIGVFIERLLDMFEDQKAPETYEDDQEEHGR